MYIHLTRIHSVDQLLSELGGIFHGMFPIALALWHAHNRTRYKSSRKTADINFSDHWVTLRSRLTIRRRPSRTRLSKMAREIAIASSQCETILIGQVWSCVDILIQRMFTISKYPTLPCKSVASGTSLRWLVGPNLQGEAPVQPGYGGVRYTCAEEYRICTRNTGTFGIFWTLYSLTSCRSQTATYVGVCPCPK